MKTPQELNKRIEATLDSLEGLSPAEPRPFFYTRVLGRLQREEKTIWEKIGVFIARPAVVISGLLIILFANALVLVQQNDDKPVADTLETITTDNDYILASSSSFDYENFEQ